MKSLINTDVMDVAVSNNFISRPISTISAFYTDFADWLYFKSIRFLEYYLHTFLENTNMNGFQVYIQ